MCFKQFQTLNFFCISANLGFGLCGIPEYLIAGLVASKKNGLTVVSNNAGYLITILSQTFFRFYPFESFYDNQDRLKFEHNLIKHNLFAL